MSVTTSLQLAGMDLSAGALLLHDGRHAEVHSISSVDGGTTLAALFEASWPAASSSGQAKPDQGAAGSTAAAAAASCCADAGCCMVLAGAERVCRTAEGCVEVCDLSGMLLLGATLAAPSFIHPAHPCQLTAPAADTVCSSAGCQLPQNSTKAHLKRRQSSVWPACSLQVLCARRWCLMLLRASRCC